MIGNSVVPGLPNRCVTPSSLSNARNAERPVMRFMKVLPCPRPLPSGSGTTWPILRGEIKEARSWLPCIIALDHRVPDAARARVAQTGLEHSLEFNALFPFRALPD